MRTRIALAGLVAGAAAFVAPVAPASAYCQDQLVILGDGGGSGECTNGCYETGEAYENARTSLADKVAAAQHIPSYWTLFVCPA
jgi:hypothetical protein